MEYADMLINVVDYLCANLAEATFTGLENILNSPRSIVIIALAILAWGIKDKIKNVVWIALMLTAMGYGSVVMDGLNIMRDMVAK